MRTTFHKVSGDVPTYEVDRGPTTIGTVRKKGGKWVARVWRSGLKREGFPTRQAAASWIRENRA
jgi:hypothetical protein